MHSVIIRSITEESTRRFRLNIETVEVVIDGVVHGPFQYGGEPEDNVRCRDYKWVEPLLVTILEAVGANFEVIKCEKGKTDEI
jgi:hypothetical protein